MTSKHAILYGLKFSGNLLGMFTNDLSRQEMHHRTVPTANPAGWILGHLILTDRSLIKLLGGEPPALPSEDFETRFGRGENAPAANDFGDVESLPALFKAHRDALVAAVEAADDSVFDRPLEKPSRIASTVGEMLAFVPIHVAMHAGQITLIRRSLGRPPLV